LLNYAASSTMVDRMKAIGFAEWRVGVGRWEIATRLLPALSDGTSCAPELAQVPASLKAPPGATDTSLVADRDWFTDTGTPVTLADTDNDARYSLAYLRAVLDQAAAFGASPYVDLDQMPRALAGNRTFFRGGMPQGVPDPCFGTWVNHVSNSVPASADVFSAAAVGLVRRIVEGTVGVPGRDAPYWEIWNEPELGYAWDPALGTLDQWFQMAALTLVKLDAYRTASVDPRVRALHFGLGSFANAPTAVATISSFDTQPLPDGSHLPFDFVSFHSYSNDPLKIVSDIQSVVDARAASTHYKTIELALSEWGPQLDAPPPATTMDLPLLASTVLVRGASLGLDRAHHSIIAEFIPGLAYTVVTADGTPKPMYHAYELLHELIGGGADRLPIAGAADGAFDGGMGAAIATRVTGGPIRVFLVNRGDAARTARIDVAGVATAPTHVEVFDDPAQPVHDATPSVVVAVPARSVVLATL
jgi:hypothetical protein